MFFFSFFAFFWGENGFLTSSAHNRTAAHALWQMAGGADQRLHMWGFQGGVGGGEGEGGLWGGTRVQRIFIQSRFFLIRHFGGNLPVLDNVEMVGEILGLFGETQNRRWNAGRSLPSSRDDWGGGGWGVFFGCCSAGVIRARRSGLNNSAAASSTSPSPHSTPT